MDRATGLDAGWWVTALGAHERFTSAPAWAGTVRAACTADHPAADHPDDDWVAAFGRIVHPFVAIADDRITTRAATLTATVDVEAVVGGISLALRDKLVALAARALVTELRGRADRGGLDGPDPAARFRDFVTRMSTPAARVDLFGRYPVLGRLLGQATDAAAIAAVELLDRFDRDRDDLVATFFPDGDPGVLVAVDVGRGDVHRGRSVAALTFAEGARLIYKPRDVLLQRHLGELVSWLNDRVAGLGLRAVRTLACDGYGWSEFVEAAPLADAAHADRFYFRHGALLALLHAVRATDMHYANVIAAGDTPVPVDVETMFHPELVAAAAGDPAAAALADSVYRTALLPLIAVGDQGTRDLSALGGDADRAPVTVVSWQDAGTDRMRLVRVAARAHGAANRPKVGAAELDPRAHQAALREGFRATFDRIAAHKTAFADLVTACADMAARMVIRPTWVYTSMLDESTHPDLLSDGPARDRAFAMLSSGTDGPLRTLASCEIADLWAGDVPIFTVTPGGDTVHDSSGAPTGVRLPRPGLRLALDGLTAMDDFARREQEWVIAATLATRSTATGHIAGHLVAPQPIGTPADPDALLAAACAVGDQLVAGGHRGGDRVNWLGLELVDDRQWLVLPLGAGLATGYLGVALFLAQLGAATGIARYTDHAHLAVRPLPAALAHLASRPDLADAVGCGGLNGIGGIAYGAARVATLLDDAELRGAAEFAVSLAVEVAGRTTDPSWAGGHAGALAATAAVHATPAARRCADLLAAGLAENTTLPGGFARGRAGIGWALVHHGGPAHERLGRSVLAEATADAAAGGWCSGPAGVLAARGLDPGTSWPDPGRLRDLSLCHGESGVVEALGVLAREHPARTDLALGLRSRISLVLAAVQREELWCGVPDGLATPGLLNGLAGIGYTLARLAMPDIPSVLFLEPAHNTVSAR